MASSIIAKKGHLQFDWGCWAGILWKIRSLAMHKSMWFGESIDFRNNKLIQHLAVGWGTVLEQRQLHAIMSPNHGDMGSNNFSSSMDSWPLNTEEINQLDWTDHAIDKDASTIHRYPPLSTLPAKASNLLAVLAVQHHVDPFVYEHHLEEARCHSCSPQTNSTWFVWSPELVA